MDAALGSNIFESNGGRQGGDQQTAQQDRGARARGQNRSCASVHRAPFARRTTLAKTTLDEITVALPMSQVRSRSSK
jgi:hypothetical protein